MYFQKTKLLFVLGVSLIIISCQSEYPVSNTAKFHAVFKNFEVNKVVESRELLLSEIEKLSWHKITEVGIIIDPENFLKFKLIKKDYNRGKLFYLTQNKKGNKLTVEVFSDEDRIRSTLINYFEKFETYEITY